MERSAVLGGALCSARWSALQRSVKRSMKEIRDSSAALGVALGTALRRENRSPKRYLFDKPRAQESAQFGERSTGGTSFAPYTTLVASIKLC
ncbi:hypothetical protein ZHAS_00001256 [Anopheles sinensis]|uniref:Uncharacterized protein n=1 Tax=Anopheles sinensis TaxID=74873 RepID=A0A084WUZ7_ANOSI|nr:hypothetical protein ZHAS_00001256 [Anopheles sinensis]